MRLPRTTSDIAPQALGEGLALGVVGVMCAKGRRGTKERGVDLDLRSYHESKKGFITDH